jgi:hypothetical protein
MRTLEIPLLLTLSFLPAGAAAVVPPVGFSLESAVFERAGGAGLRLTAVTSCWLVDGLEVEARLGFGSADRPDGRGADAVTPGLGLRWGPDLGRWRPVAGLEAGLVFSRAGGAPARTGAVRGGVAWFPRRDLSVGAGLAWRRTSGAVGGLEAVVGLGYYP